MQGFAAFTVKIEYAMYNKPSYIKSIDSPKNNQVRSCQPIMSQQKDRLTAARAMIFAVSQQFGT